MRKTLALTIILFYVLSSAGLAEGWKKEDWKEVSGEHFLVYYLTDKKFAKNVAEQSEVYYKRIATEMGYQRYSDFWLWDKRVKIYIYDKRERFLKATGQPTWS